jgi:hypothetical protein
MLTSTHVTSACAQQFAPDLLHRRLSGCLNHCVSIIDGSKQCCCRLPEPQRTKFRDALVPEILKFLAIKRQVDCNRMDFFAYAEAFASLVKMDFIAITGMIESE